MKGVSLIKRFKWLVIALVVIFPLLSLGGVHFGPISIRLIVAYGLFVYLLIFKRQTIAPTKEAKWYYIFLAVFVFVNLISFRAFSGAFLRKMIAMYLVCCIAIYAFPRVFKTEVSIRSASIVLSITFLFNAVTTYLQYQNSPIGWVLGMTINPVQEEELEVVREQMDEFSEFNISFIPGIMGGAVNNGYFIATMLPIVTFYIWDKFRFRIRTLWTLGMLAIGAICVYIVQERMALAVFAVYLLSIFLFKKKNAVRILVTMAIVVFAIVFFGDNIQRFDFSQMGRLANDIEDTNYRGMTFPLFADFISDPKQLLIGNSKVRTMEDLVLFRSVGHNTFLDCIRRGGIILFIPFVILFYHICKSLIKFFRFARRNNDYRTMGLAMGCFCYLLYSQTHSHGIQSGAIFFWVFYMLTQQSYRIKYEAIRRRSVVTQVCMVTQEGNIPEDNVAESSEIITPVVAPQPSSGGKITPVKFSEEVAVKGREVLAAIKPVKMNIVIIAYDYPDERRTVFPFIAQMVEQWAKMGHNCWVVAPYSVVENRRMHKFKEVVERKDQGTITILRPNFFTIPRMEIGGRRITLTIHEWAVKYALNFIPGKPDIVYGHFWEQAHEGFRYAKRHKIPLYVASGESDISKQIDDWHDKWKFCEYISGVVCVSNKNMQECVKLRLADEYDCAVIPNAVSAALFHKLDKTECRRKLGIEEDAFVIAYVGWFNERKGARRLVQAIKMCNDPSIQSIFLGAGPYEPECPNIVAKGKRPYQKVPLYLNAADIFVLPTINEGCSNAVVEALACGLPVVSSDRAFNWDILNKQNSIMVEPLDIKAISQAIMLLKNDPVLRQAMSDAALATAKTLDLEKRAAAIISLFESHAI